MTSKAKAEAIKLRKEANSDKKDGIKQLSRAIESEPAKPLLCVKRDRDTPDGGKQGEITTNPEEVDAIVKRAWKEIYDGMAGCMDTAIDLFFDKFKKEILKHKEYVVQAIDDQMVFDSFSKTVESAGSRDGWRPKELSLLSNTTCDMVAIMLNQIEDGSTVAEIRYSC